MGLLATFRASAPAALRDVGGAGLEQALAELAARGAAERPSLPLDPALLVAQAARHLPLELLPEQLPAALLELRAGELHLACACAAQSAAALATFEKEFLASPALRKALARVDRSATTADEVRQALREKLFVGAPGGAPRIADYSGRWPLAGWLRMAAVRTAIDLHRRTGEPPAAPAELERAEQLTASVEPELRYLKQRYAAVFQEALGKALAALDPESCNLLRLQLAEGLHTAQIAALFRVDRSTIKRRLASCRATLLAGTRRELSARLQLSTAEFESLAGLVRSQLHLSIARLLRSRAEDHG